MQGTERDIEIDKHTWDLNETSKKGKKIHPIHSIHTYDID